MHDGQSMPPHLDLPPLSIAFLSTSPPRKCGIATFTSDLTKSIKLADPQTRISWAAIEDGVSIRPYGADVRWRINQRQPASYERAADEINASSVDLVHVQHEFGLYGVWGETFDDYLTPFMERLTKPLITTLHSVLPAPTASVRAAVQRIGRHSRVVLAMAELAHDLLVDRYELDPARVQVIPHGVPPIEPRGRTQMKKRLDLRDRTIISTFGLLDPRKGLEYMIGAMSTVITRHPDALYLIVGKTHPDLVRTAGEAYRNELQRMIQAHGLEGHVAFVDEYLTQREIVDYLLASDVYVTPYLDPNQITSGTLAYALGAGKAIVSTPYLHAVEALGEDRGVLVGFRDTTALATAVTGILDDPALKRRLEANAYDVGRHSAWPLVGERTLALYHAVTGGLADGVEAVDAPGVATSLAAIAPSDPDAMLEPVIGRT